MSLRGGPLSKVKGTTWQSQSFSHNVCLLPSLHSQRKKRVNVISTEACEASVVEKSFKQKILKTLNIKFEIKNLIYSFFQPIGKKFRKIIDIYISVKVHISPLAVIIVISAIVSHPVICKDRKIF